MATGYPGSHSYACSVSVPHSPRAVILLSGGLDSAVTLAIARDEVPGGASHCHAISFDYGQRHRHELFAARRVAMQLGIPDDHHTILRIDLRAIGGSALTDAAIAVPKDRSMQDLAHGIPTTYVPARNLIFLSCAAGLAETVHAAAIYIGVNAVDYSGYPDCREAFIRSFEETVNLGTKAGVEAITRGRGERALEVRTPLVHMTKAEIIRTGARLGVDFSLTHSCYDPIVMSPEAAPLACGRCDSCVIRARGFKESGVSDPTRYAC